MCIGDIHLGRAPARLPEDAALLEQCSPREALRRAVSLAKSRAVDIVLLTGDTTDHENAFFEAYAALNETVSDLTAAGIEVFAVAGNHDFSVLPSLAGEIPSFTVLGSDGEWEEKIFTRDDRPLLRIQGRSFTSPHEHGNPLENYREAPPGIPSLALLHCDVDNPGSCYFPVNLAELKLSAPSAWLLGHVHKPQVLQESPLILYPGSLQPLDPGEKGAHGPWIFEIEDGRLSSVTQHPLASLRYEEVEVDIEGAETLPEAQALIKQTLQKWLEAHQVEIENVVLISCRLRLYGATRLLRELEHLAEDLQASSEPLLGKVFIEKVEFACRPRLSLPAIAGQYDAVGLLARRLLALQNKAPEEEYRQLTAAASTVLREIHDRYAFTGLPLPAQLSEKAAVDLLQEVGGRLLEELLAQKRVTA